MSFNPLTPEQLAHARVVVSRIKENFGEFQIRERAASLGQANTPIEKAYRTAEAQLEQAKRRVGEIEAGLKERDEELLAVAAEQKTDDGKPRFTTDTAKKAGAVALRKTDPEYLAIKTELGLAKEGLRVAELEFAHAKADQRALNRAHEQLLADKAYLTACVAGFAEFDTPAAAPATPTP